MNGTPVIAASDYVAAVPDLIRPWVRDSLCHARHRRFWAFRHACGTTRVLQSGPAVDCVGSFGCDRRLTCRRHRNAVARPVQVRKVEARLALAFRTDGSVEEIDDFVVQLDIVFQLAEAMPFAGLNDDFLWRISCSFERADHCVGLFQRRSNIVRACVNQHRLFDTVRQVYGRYVARISGRILDSELDR